MELNTKNVVPENRFNYESQNFKGCRIPEQFFNPLGFIQYDHYGRKPWSIREEENGTIFLPPYYTSITNLLAIDCEMVGVGDFNINALARISIVNEHGYCIYDKFVRPRKEVTDFRTEFSGVRPEDLINATDTDTVLKEVAEMVESKTLIGHAIANDLDVLKLNNHPRHLIRDTAIYFMQEQQLKLLPSLKDLTNQYLRFNIQTGEHSSIQDAQATLKLYLMHRDKWEDFIIREEIDNLSLDCNFSTTPNQSSELCVEPIEPDLFVDSQIVSQKENPVIGAYSSCEKYLYVQFQLLLEDFLRPLKDGVNMAEWKKFKKNSLFHNVQIQIDGKSSNLEVNRCGTILVPIDQSELQNVDWKESTIFTIGSLLLLTTEDFKTVKFAVIKSRIEFPIGVSNQEFLKLGVEFSKQGSSWTVDESNNQFLMMESSSFHDTYKFSVEYLQTVDLNTFPLKKYIVDAVTTPHPPPYLRYESRKLDFSVLLNRLVESSSQELYRAAPMDLKNWPTAYQLHFDGGQYEAFQKAVTQEMTIIQGPPGTGKTFLKMQIIKLLLSNYWLINSPIIIVGFTNQVVDRTLEQIFDFISIDLGVGKEEAHKMILRIGSGSKSEIIQPLAFKNKLESHQEKKMLSKRIGSFHRILNSIKDLNFQNLLVRQGILNFQKLPAKIFDQLSEDTKSKLVLDKWKKCENQIIKDPLNWYGLNGKYVGITDGLFLVTFHQDFLLSSYLDSISQYLDNNWLTSENISGMLEQCEGTGLNRIKILSSRWALYFHLIKCVKCIVEETNDKIKSLEEEYSQIENSVSVETSIRAAKVIGMTTTGAVKYKDIFHKTKPKIMIVEEAAHILEALVVASLSEYCQQMIMIGDYKRLRNLTAGHNFVSEYNAGLSLMTRLIQNGEIQGNQNWTQLKVQHRMRPEIARMVCPVIYQGVFNHPDVYNFPDVKGCSKNVFFVDHRNAESRDKGSGSCYNKYEVNCLFGFIKYFLNEGFYQPNQITVLAAEYCQKMRMENKLGNLVKNGGVKVSSIDDYQGEENDIILLSLVRSNDKNDIGSLKTDSKVCIAMSRARHGLFMIGNMYCLKAASKTWRKINTTLVKMGSIGNYLPFAGSGNVKIESESMIEKICPWGHMIKYPSHLKKEPQCSSMVIKILSCGHEEEMECHQSPLEVICHRLVVKSADCSHKTIIECNKVASLSPGCDRRCEKIFNCGHQCRFVCHGADIRPHMKYQCIEKCRRQCSQGHPCTVNHECYKDCPMSKNNCNCLKPKASPSPKSKNAAKKKINSGASSPGFQNPPTFRDHPLYRQPIYFHHNTLQYMRYGGFQNPLLQGGNYVFLPTPYRATPPPNLSAPNNSANRFPGSDRGRYWPPNNFY